MRSPHYLSLSLGLHGALVLLALLLKPSGLPETKSIPEEPIQIKVIEKEFTQAPLNVTNSMAKGQAKKKTFTPRRSTQKSQKGRLGESTSKLKNEGLTFQNNFKIYGTGKFEGEHYPFGERGSDFDQIQNFIPIDRLAREVEGLLSYPGPLALRDYSGGVRVQLFFNSDGGCDWSRTEITSSSRYFRVYILALVKKLCRLEQVKEMKLYSGQRIDMTFNFFVKNVLHGHDPEIQPTYTLVGNVLNFERHHYKLPIEVKAGPLRFYGPYVAVDFPWLFEKWDEIFKDKDPLEDFR